MPQFTNLTHLIKRGYVCLHAIMTETHEGLKMNIAVKLAWITGYGAGTSHRKDRECCTSVIYLCVLSSLLNYTNIFILNLKYSLLGFGKEAKFV